MIQCRQEAGSRMAAYIHWFRRDLRLEDNPALSAALRQSGGQVIPLFVFDPVILAATRTGTARVAFLIDSLRALDQALREHGSRLVVRYARPCDPATDRAAASVAGLLAVFTELIDEAGTAGVYWNRDYSPFAQARDSMVATALQAR